MITLTDPTDQKMIAAPKLKLSIVLGTYNRLENLTACLNSLLGKISIPHQIVVADAGSTDGSIAYVQTHPSVVLIQDGDRLGQAKSLNQVFRKIQSEYVCWISDDNIVVADELERAVATMENNPSIGMLSLKVKDIAGRYVNAAYLGGIWSSTGVLNVNQGLVRLSILQSVDYFDEEFRDYGIDADLTTKILLAGHQIAYTKNVVILHNRDYELAPGAIGEGDRTPKMERAKRLYEKKYLATFKKLRRTRWQHFGFVVKLIYQTFQIVKYLLGRPSPGLFRFNDRDWYNVMHGAYIDKRDLWLNYKNDFYLVQQIHGASNLNIESEQNS